MLSNGRVRPNDVLAALVYFDVPDDANMQELRLVCQRSDTYCFTQSGQLCPRNGHCLLTAVVNVHSRPELPVLVLAIDDIELDLKVVAVTGLRLLRFYLHRE